MRLAISNLAWPAARENGMFGALARLGVAGVEVAPTRLAAWDAVTAPLLADYRARVEAAGLVVSSLQAVLFGRPELQLLGDDADFRCMLEHMRRVANIGASLGAEVLVFGAPRNRIRAEMELKRAWARARRRFRTLGEITLSAGIIIGIEPVPAFYGGDFLTAWPDVLRLVREIDHPGVCVHLDTGCVALAGDKIDAAIIETGKLLTHFHAAQPQLDEFVDPLPDHELAATALHMTGYDRWIAIEMREQSGDPAIAAARAVQAVRKAYRL